MPKLVKRSTNFAVEYFDPKKGFTTRRSLGTDDAREAQRLFAEWCLKNLDEVGTLESVTVGGLLASFYAKQAQNYPSKYVYKSALSYVGEFIPDLPLAQFRRKQQEDFISKLREEKLAEGTIKRLMAAISTSVNYAYERDLIPSKPHILSVSDNARRDRPLTDDEARALIRACETTSEKRYIALALMTGARPGAILGLQKRQFDFSHHILRLLPYGEKQVKQKPKPTIPLPKALEDIAVGWEDGYVVHLDHKPLNDHRHIWERISTGLPEDIVCYDLRHTAATELRRQGVPEWDISGYLGHTGPGAKTTGAYAHYRPEFMRAAADAMDKYWSRLNAQLRVGCGNAGEAGESSEEGRRAA
jgi:integrase